MSTLASAVSNTKSATVTASTTANVAMNSDTLAAGIGAG
jgi:hypothetical protein